MDYKMLDAATQKVKDLYHLIDDKSIVRLQKARDLVILNQVKPFKSERYPDSFHVHSATERKEYIVNLGELTCQCRNFSDNNLGDTETKHLCKHIIAAFIYRHYHAMTTENMQYRINQTLLSVKI